MRTKEYRSSVEKCTCLLIARGLRIYRKSSKKMVVRVKITWILKIYQTEPNEFKWLKLCRKLKKSNCRSARETQWIFWKRWNPGNFFFKGLVALFQAITVYDREHLCSQRLYWFEVLVNFIGLEMLHDFERV